MRSEVLGKRRGSKDSFDRASRLDRTIIALVISKDLERGILRVRYSSRSNTEG